MDKQSKSELQKSLKRIYLVVRKQDHDSYYDLYSDKKIAIMVAKNWIREAVKNYGFTKKEEKAAITETEKISRGSEIGEWYSSFLENDSVEVLELEVDHEDNS